MPPRGARGARGTRGGRGSSTTARGGSATTSRGSASDASAAQVPQESSEAQTSAPAPAAAATPNPSSDNATPSSRPASQTPVASSSSAPRPAGGLKFKPKAIRRDASERKRLEEQRDRDLASKIKAEEKEQRAANRRANRGGRGRGNAMSQRGMIRRTVTANGPFSAIASENVKDGAAFGGGGGGGRGWGGGGGGGSSRFADIPHANSIRYRPRREHEPRVNADALSGIPGDDDEYQDQSLHHVGGYSRTGGALPVGLFRTEHQEQELKVATTAELEAEDAESDPGEDEDLFVSPEGADDAQGPDDIMKDDNERWHAAPPESAVRVKAEPGTEPDDAMDVDLADIPEATAAQVKPPPSPEQQKKKPLVARGEVSAAAERKEKRREKALQDPEVQHTMYDLQALLQELSFQGGASGDNTAAAAADAAAAAAAEKDTSEDKEQQQEQEQEQEQESKDGRLYLFQLPPILPPLADPEADDGDGSNKKEGDGNGRRASSSTPRIKTEDGANRTSSENETSNNSSKSSHIPAAGGHIGRLNVRRSGKVQLDWGGTTLDLGMGAEADFLASALVLETREVDPDTHNGGGQDAAALAGMLTGTATGMGQVMGRFVLTPVWDEEEDWDPSVDEVFAELGMGGEGEGEGGEDITTTL